MSWRGLLATSLSSAEARSGVADATPAARRFVKGNGCCASVCVDSRISITRRTSLGTPQGDNKGIHGPYPRRLHQVHLADSGLGSAALAADVPLSSMTLRSTSLLSDEPINAAGGQFRVGTHDYTYDRLGIRRRGSEPAPSEQAHCSSIASDYIRR
jgi:hypothetical protein